ncbi:MAG: hypothetical protein RMY16_32515 [Nostoc sp. DedQUE12b]|uniref:hypothetical protein n=1 Tax=Nostoc sp. DedQUE12b TaxID=3075398 RepID=UPI002AD3B768|nr:hypothetical protein [Nostoc sp. DedQUE12b]MDZ8090239.1 hypothetical protein [Nostoc sp. DedQUE12b]
MIEGIIGVEIPLYPQMTEDEIALRVEQEEAAQLAMTCFCNGSITLEEYMDILEMCEVDMDSYCLNLEQNLNATGLIVV